MKPKVSLRRSIKFTNLWPYWSGPKGKRYKLLISRMGEVNITIYSTDIKRTIRNITNNFMSINSTV